MRHGLILMGASFAEQLEIARHADARGMHSVWSTEFFNHNGFVRMTAVAAATRQVKVGTAIAYAFMRAPLLAASAAMDVDELSEGRVILGLGTGTRSMNEKWYSVPFDKPPAPRMREVVQLVRAAFDAQKGGGLRFDGEFYRAQIPQYARPGAARERIPIYIAGVNKHMIRVASEVADGLIGHPIYTRKYIAEKVKPVLEGTSCELAPYVVCSISDDVDQARREARAQIAFYYTTRLYHSVLDVHGWRGIGEEIAQAFRRGDYKAMSEAVSDELLDAIAITGRPEEARDRLKQWEGLSDHLLIYPASAGVSAQRLRESSAAIVEAVGGAAA